ncbi:hypothetical protein ABK040_004810 [Willaertia magna]
MIQKLIPAVKSRKFVFSCSVIIAIVYFLLFLYFFLGNILDSSKNKNSPVDTITITTTEIPELTSHDINYQNNNNFDEVEEDTITNKKYEKILNQLKKEDNKLNNNIRIKKWKPSRERFFDLTKRKFNFWINRGKITKQDTSLAQSSTQFGIKVTIVNETEIFISYPNVDKIGRDRFFLSIRRAFVVELIHNVVNKYYKGINTGIGNNKYFKSPNKKEKIMMTKEKESAIDWRNNYYSKLFPNKRRMKSIEFVIDVEDEVRFFDEDKINCIREGIRPGYAPVLTYVGCEISSSNIPFPMMCYQEKTFRLWPSVVEQIKYYSQLFPWKERIPKAIFRGGPRVCFLNATESGECIGVPNGRRLNGERVTIYEDEMFVNEKKVFGNNGQQSGLIDNFEKQVTNNGKRYFSLGNDYGSGWEIYSKSENDFKMLNSNKKQHQITGGDTFYTDKKLFRKVCGRRKVMEIGSERTDLFDVDIYDSAKNIPMILQERYKYMIYAEGQSGWANRLKRQLFMGTALLKQSTQCHEWYDYDLEPFVHYIPVDYYFNNLTKAVEWCKQNDYKVQMVIENMHRYAESYLHIAHMEEYVFHILEMFHHLIDYEINDEEILKRKREGPGRMISLDEFMQEYAVHLGV